MILVKDLVKSLVSILLAKITQDSDMILLKGTQKNHVRNLGNSSKRDTIILLARITQVTDMILQKDLVKGPC